MATEKLLYGQPAVFGAVSPFRVSAGAYETPDGLSLDILPSTIEHFLHSMS
jgi:hypothetical protein